jgi:hypothetical protein
MAGTSNGKHPREMAGRRCRPNGPRLRGRRPVRRDLFCVTALLVITAGLVTVPGLVRPADAAFPGQPWQTNFEIDGNEVVNGPSPPSGGAGVDWANAASFLQDFGNVTEACTGTDPTTISGKLDDFNVFAPNPVPGQILAKGDLCQAAIGWEVINVTTPTGATELHYILYSAWRRNPVPGEISFYVPLIGGPTKQDVTLIKFNYDSAGQGSTSVSELRWNGSTWVETALSPTTAFNSAVNAGQSPSFGEFAVDLTATSILPSTPSTCQTFSSSFVFTQTGNAASAELKDYIGMPPLEISNCSQIEITKVTDPAVPDPPATFTYNLTQIDGGPVQDSTPYTPPNSDANPSLAVLNGSLTVPGSPTDDPGNIIAATGYQLLEGLPPPSPWSHVSVVCNYFNPLVLDANLNATPATATLTNPNGSPTGQTFVVSPPGLLPPGVTVAARCTISNEAPTLTLVKNVANDVRGPLATPDMWVLQATNNPAGTVDFGPGTSAGVTRVVPPGTWALAETRNGLNPPPIGYTDGTVWTCDAPVTNNNLVTIGPTDHVTCSVTNTANPAQLTLQKVVDNTAGGTATVGDFTLTATFATPGDPGSVDGQPISGVTGAPAVTDRLVKRGVFNLSETEIPGYVPSWSCVDATGATVSTSNQVNVPVDVTSLLQLDLTCTVTNTFAALNINISGPAINPVGIEHTFTLTATSTSDGVNFTPLAGALLDLDFTTENGLDIGAITFGANTCETAPGTNALGQCTVTVNSSASGVLNIIANGFTNEGPNGPNPGAAFALPSPVSSNKRWREYRVEGAPSGINLVGQAHTFTLSGVQIAGTIDGGAPNEGPLQEGALINFTWNGPQPPTGPTVVPAGSGFQCTVGADGTCQVTVTSTGPATGTLTVTGIVVELLNGQTATSATTFTLNYPGPALQEPAPVLTKAWVKFAVGVTPSAVNLIGEAHTFTLTVTRDTGSGPQPVGDGTIVDFDWDGDGTPTPSGSCVVTGGTCTVTVTSNTPGIGTLSVLDLRDVAVTAGNLDVTFPIVTVDASGALTVPAPVQKRWVQVEVAISQGADNLAGEPHTFTVQVTAFDGDGGFPDGTGVPDAIVDASAVTIVGGATLTNDGTCDEGTDANGQCTLIVTNPGSGSITVRLDQVSLVVDGQPFVIPLVPGARGIRADATLPIQADKVWWQYRVILSDSSINPLGVDHTFIATVQRTNDGGTTWVPVPDGSTLDAVWIDPNAVSQVNPSSTCSTTGTVGGNCTFIVSSTAATTGTLSVRAIAATWLDRNRNGQAGAPTDPVPNPVEFASEIVNIPASDFGAGSVLTARKTWWDFAVDVSGPAENPVGTNHTFTLTVRFSDGGASAFRPVATGTTMTYAWTGPTGSAENAAQSTCDPVNGPGTNVSGQCTVVIASPTVPGTGTLTITGINSTTIPQPTRQVSFTFPTPGTTTKTWIAYRALITPNSTNLAGTPHTFTITAQQDRGDGSGFVAVPDGTILAVTLSDATKLTGTTCTGGTVGGTCTVTVSSDTPGAVTVTPGAMTVSLLDGTGARSPVTVQPGSAAYATPPNATKTWVALDVSVTPPTATNLVGQSHTFTVHVDTIGADGTTTPQPAPDGTTVTWSFNGPGLVAAGSTTCNVGTAGGECDITFTNAGTPGTGTLTITSATFTVNGEIFTVDLTAGGPAQATTPPPITATKTWIAYAVAVTPSANNPVGTQHDFTITATIDDGTGSAPAAGATITYTWSGAGTLLTPSPCTTSASGTCTVSVVSPAAGTGILTVTSLTDSSGATVDLTNPGAVGQAAGQVVPLTASKTWLQYRVLLDTAATNLVGQSHTFNATVQQSALETPTDADWTGVPDGTTLAASASGSGSLDQTSTCLAGGTTGGTCTFVVHDAGPGTLDLTVTAIATTTVDGEPFANIALTTPATTSKTWVSVAVTVTPPAATNIAGQSHTFTVQVDLLGADGTATPQPAPDGTTVTWTFTGPGTTAAGTTCTSPGTSAGTCTITLANNGTPGAGTLTIDTVTFTANGQPFTVNFTTSGPGQATPPPITATKSWGDFRVTVTPPTATNYVGEPHTFTVLVEHDTGAGFEPLADAPVSLSTTGTAVPDPAIPTSCVTDSAGTCAITTTSHTPGTLTITATYEAASDAGAVPFTDSADKEWIPGWTLNIAKTSSVSDSSQLFAFQTDGPAPLAGQSFSLAIGQSQLFENVLPGTYTIAELTDAAHLPPPWRLQSLECTGLAEGATVAIDGVQATLTLAPPNPGSEITCTYTNERMNLFVHKTDGGATATIGGPPINYTITVGNNGSVATTDPITVTDTLPAGLAFAGSPQAPAGGSCASPVGQVLTCTLTAPIAPGATVQIIVPARALATAGTSVVNVVKIDSPEDVLCPDGTCPPPPECPEQTATAVAAVRVAAITVGGDPSDNQACVRTPVESAETPIGPEAEQPPPTTVPSTEAPPIQGILPHTGSSAMPLALAGLCIIWGVAATLVARRRRTRRSV